MAQKQETRRDECPGASNANRPQTPYPYKIAHKVKWLGS